MIFRNRLQAADLLAAKLRSLRLDKPVVLGIPRGGVPMAAAVAKHLGAELDVILVHKVCSSWQPELALGAVSEGGEVHLGRVAKALDLARGDLDQLARAQVEKLRQKRRHYTPSRNALPLSGREVVVVDDGIATGATMLAAVAALKKKNVARIVIAAPVASKEAKSAIEDENVETCFLEAPEEFHAVSQFYGEFPQVSDPEVVDVLSRSRIKKDVLLTGARVVLKGILTVPRSAAGVVLFAHGSGSGRLSPRNQYVAAVLQKAGIATLLLDLLEEREEEDRVKIFDIDLLAERLLMAADWLRKDQRLAELKTGYFGASTGVAAALKAATERPEQTAAVVSRGGRPDLAGPWLGKVEAPTLLIVGGRDAGVIELNQEALAALRCEKKLVIIPGATHLFEEAGALERVAENAAQWFKEKFAAGETSPSPPRPVEEAMAFAP